MMEARHTTDQLGWLEEEAAKRETKLAVERVDGHWRAGFVLVNRNGDVVYALNAVGPDEDTAIRRLAEMVDRQACPLPGRQRGPGPGLRPIPAGNT